MLDQSRTQQALSPTFPRVIEQPVLWGPQNNPKLAQGYKAIIDSNTGKVFSIASKDYKVISHEKAIEQIESIIAKTPHLGGYHIRVNFYNAGGRMRCTFTFPGISAEIVKGDLVKLQLHLLNSYDLAWSFTVIIGAFRLVCSNGLVIGNKIFNINRRHVYALKDLNIHQTIAMATNRFEKQAGKWMDLARIPLHPTTYEKVMNSMKLGKSATEEIRQRINRGASGYNKNFPVINLWTFYNVLTWYITHRAVSLNHRVEMENRLRTAMVYLRKVKS